LKLAHIDMGKLHLKDQSMVAYTLAHTQYPLGLTTEVVFRKQTADIVTNENTVIFCSWRTCSLSIDAKEFTVRF
jgi:glutathionyl-hydroquinone reductase